MVTQWVKDPHCCHGSSLGHCCGKGLIPGPGTSTCCGNGKKKKKKKKMEAIKHVFEIMPAKSMTFYLQQALIRIGPYEPGPRLQSLGLGCC